MPRFDIRFVPVDWDRLDEVLGLAFAILYQPFGVAPAGDSPAAMEWLHPTPGTHVAVAISREGRVLGSARLLPAAGDESRQVRQVVVSEDARQLGVGRALMLALEVRAAEEGAREVWLNSRNTAYGFYENLGYQLEGDEFISEVTSIPHRLARKRLG